MNILYYLFNNFLSPLQWDAKRISRLSLFKSKGLLKSSASHVKR